MDQTKAKFLHMKRFRFISSRLENAPWARPLRCSCGNEHLNLLHPGWALHCCAPDRCTGLSCCNTTKCVLSVKIRARLCTKSNEISPFLRRQISSTPCKTPFTFTRGQLPSQPGLISCDHSMLLKDSFSLLKVYLCWLLSMTGADAESKSRFCRISSITCKICNTTCTWPEMTESQRDCQKKNIARCFQGLHQSQESKCNECFFKNFVNKTHKTKLEAVPGTTEPMTSLKPSFMYLWTPPRVTVGGLSFLDQHRSPGVAQEEGGDSESTMSRWTC